MPLARCLVAIVAVCLPLLVPASADAGCNLIPGTAKTFDSAQGATNRPHAAPGERVELAVRSCDTTALGLTSDAADHVVTVVFTPPRGPRHAVVLTAAAVGPR